MTSVRCLRDEVRDGKVPRVGRKLALVPIPVTDVDVTAAIYADRLGFTLDVDV